MAPELQVLFPGEAPPEDQILDVINPSELPLTGWRMNSFNFVALSFLLVGIAFVMFSESSRKRKGNK